MKSLIAALLAGTSMLASQPAKETPAATPAAPSSQPATKPANHPTPPPPKPKGPMPAGHPGAAPADPTLNWPKARPEDVNSIDAIVKAFYTVPAGEKGEPRDWDRYASLFSPDARMIPARGDDKGGAMAMFVTIGEYVDLNKSYFERGGFRDSEVSRKVEQFGHIAQVWSTFESRHSSTDAEPYIRGINSIQLLKDGDRWWIVNVFWDFESPDAKLPDSKPADGKPADTKPGDTKAPEAPAAEPKVAPAAGDSKPAGH